MPQCRNTPRYQKWQLRPGTEGSFHIWAHCGEIEITPLLEEAIHLKPAVLALEDGTVFEGRSFGAPAERAGEVVFNTSITGYQEIFTDPSYAGQIVVLTNPQIGNYGTNSDDNEAARPYIEGLVVREFSPSAEQLALRRDAPRSSWPRAGIPVVSGIDTRRPGAASAHARRDARRALRHRDGSSEAGRESPEHSLRWRARTWPRAFPRRDATNGPSRRRLLAVRAGSGRRGGAAFHVVAYDFGIKHNILRRLVQVGCRVTVVPAAHLRRRCAGAEAGRRLPLQRPGRPGAARISGCASPQADGPRARSSASAWATRSGPGARRQDLQAEVRPPRRAITRCSTSSPARWKSPRTTTASPWTPIR